jgi:hypothetical protein
VSLDKLAVNVGRLEENMQRMETDLDGLIRAITSDHKNGKSH